MAASYSGPKQPLTRALFIERARQKHGGAYDYAFVEYQNAHTKVLIQCRRHGLFEQEPQNHLDGHGCGQCSAGGRRVSRQQFIEACQRKHGNRYDYSRVVYQNSNEKVEIRCRLHGFFWQEARGHKTGYGCPKCKNLDRRGMKQRKKEPRKKSY